MHLANFWHMGAPLPLITPSISDYHNSLPESGERSSTDPLQAMATNSPLRLHESNKGLDGTGAMARELRL
jgi:hypothetical protein